MNFKNYFSFLIFFLLTSGSLLLLSANAAGQSTSSGEISGTVLDETNRPFPYASISLLNAKDSVVIKGTLSKEDGTYHFNTVKNGDYLVAIYIVGYKRMVKGPYVINTGKLAYELGDNRLVQDAKMLRGVEIVKQRSLIEKQIDKTVINVENSALAAGNTALEILQKSPGVTVDKDGNISLKGKQGVNVMLDGKPTYLSSEQLANLLRSTEGSAIQLIELITNPSAKYDAAGNSGIINIKLKKNRNYGTNGSVLAGVGYGRYYKANGGLTLNHREERFNVYGNFNYGRNKRFGSTDIVRVNDTETDKTYFNQTNTAIRNRNNTNYKAGADYFLNEKNTLGIALNGYNGNGRNLANVQTLIGASPFKTDSSVVATNPNDYKYTGISYNLNYKGVLDTLGQEISIDVDHSNYTGRENNDFNNHFFDAYGQVLKPAYIFRNATPTRTNIWAAKVDYVYPVNKEMKLEGGLKSSFVKTDNNFIFENLLGDIWENDLKRSNQFLYNEYINAAYANLNRKFKTTTIQLGFRLEQTNSKGNSITENKVVKRNYLDLFPSLFINQELSKEHEMGFSFSRRIDRPDYESMNPFIAYLDLYSYRFGNPFLKPQYTNAFELSYSYKKTLNLTFGYSHTKDVISDVLLTDTIKKTIFISNQNLATQDSYNMNLSYPLQITRWWSSNNNLTVFYNKFKTPDLLGASFESGKVAFNLNTNQTITLSPSTSLECSGYYQSRRVNGTILTVAECNVDMGLRKSLMNKKMDIKFTANDLFKMQKNRISSTLPSQKYVITDRWESQVFRLTCTYRFGSNSIKGARQRSGSAESEGSRVKSGG